METYNKVLDAIATLENFLIQNQELVDKSRAALGETDSFNSSSVYKVRHDCVNRNVGDLWLPHATIGSLQEKNIFSLIDLIEYCNENGIPSLRKLPRVGRKSYLELLESLSNICEGNRDFVKEFSYRT